MRIKFTLILCLITLLPLTAYAHSGAKKTAEGVGVIHHIDSKQGTINMTTQPIEKLGWSEMTMDWNVVDGVKLNHLKTGEHVRFSLKQSHNRLHYDITSIEIINQTAHSQQGSASADSEHQGNEH